MNDYSMGALEALSWARAVLVRCDSREDFEGARVEIEGMMIKLASGAYVNFRMKAELIELP